MYYAAPELVVGSAGPTVASDVFSLATILYETLTSRLPFQAESPSGAITRMLQTPHDPIATIPDVFDRAFAKNPAARIPDLATFASVLLQAVPDAREYDAVVSDRVASWRP